MKLDFRQGLYHENQGHFQFYEVSSGKTLKNLAVKAKNLKGKARERRDDRARI
jgi:hypothetical protein